MKKKMYIAGIVCFIFVWSGMAGGCAGDEKKASQETIEKHQEDAEQENENDEILQKEAQQNKKESSENTILDRTTEESLEETDLDPTTEESTKEAIAETEEMDWSEYFDGIQGAAVVYNPVKRQYLIYNRELAQTRRSPCSTFKIISSLTALEHGIMEPEQSVRTWSGELFWNEEWNRDLNFSEAFRSSCVWYFRELINEIGPERMQKEIDKLVYGNGDISDWEGQLNMNNQNPALTGFWIESSLKISPKEQAEVMERIFGENSMYSQETLNELKQVMLVQEQVKSDISIYGKTGMGKVQGEVVDAWFTGFAEQTDQKWYFCVYLGRTDEKDVSSAVAKEVAIQLMQQSKFY